MPHITNSNAENMISKLRINDLDLKDSLYKLNIDFFNKFETNLLLITKLFFESPEKFYEEKYVKQIGRSRSQSLVYEHECGPAYHKDPKCPRLFSDYKNFEIPSSILDKGPEEVSRYRKWFKERESIFENNPSQFLELLAVSWGVRSTESSLKLLKKEYSNSGAIEIENTNLDTLECKIDNLIKGANNLIATNPNVLDAYHIKNAYLWNKPNLFDTYRARYSDEDQKIIVNVLATFEKDFKQPLMSVLKEYYRIKFNPDIEIKEDLLKQLGFSPCRCSIKEFKHGEKLVFAWSNSGVKESEDNSK